MGSKNRERRKAKQKARAEQRRHREERSTQLPPDSPFRSSPFGGSPFGGSAGPAASPSPPVELVEALAKDAVHALHHKDEETFQSCCGILVDAAAGGASRRAVDAALFRLALRELTAVWARGWQPADTVRFTRREYGPRNGRIAIDLIAAEARGYAAATIDERWEAQLRELGTAVWWERDDEYLTAMAERENLDRPEAIRRMLEVLHILARSPQIQVLCPPPGQARRGSLGAAAVDGRTADPRQLDRVRALLAKAESTSFSEEAEAYTAKAQELMARHSIDYALLSVTTGSNDQPTGRRISIDNPYEAPKALLLDVVARANRCQAIWASEFGFATSLGYPADLDAVELLFTSLLVQATTAVVQEGKHRDAYGRSSTRSFRQSFLTAYAQRIGERLATATAQATEQARQDLSGRPGADRLLPVLASRESAVGAMRDELFPSTVGRSVAVTNRAGWASGRAAADRAQLTGRRAMAES